MPRVPLYDIIAPCYLAGDLPSRDVHTVLGALYVRQVESTWDERTVCLWGTAELDDIAPPRFDLTSNGFTFDIDEMVTDVPPDPHRPPPGTWLDLHDTQIRFRLTLPRTASPLVAGALPNVPGGGGPVLNFLGPPAQPGAPSDFPDTQLSLDLMLTAVTVHLPFLRGARLVGEALREDPAHPDVTVVLPKVLLRITDGAPGTAGSAPSVRLLSWGADSFDGQSQESAQLVEMTPPYALIGPGEQLGFGFRGAILDLDEDFTPPEVMETYGIGDDWQGLYLPEVLVFFAPDGFADLEFTGTATDLLIGLGQTGGVWGAFELAIVNANPPKVSVRLHDELGGWYPAVPAGEGRVAAVVSAGRALSVVADLAEAKPPYATTIDGRNAPGQVMDIAPLEPGEVRSVPVEVTDAQSPPRTTRLNVTVTGAPTVGPAAPAGPSAGTVTLEPDAAQTTPGARITLLSQTDTTAVVGFWPPDPTAATVAGAPLTLVGGTATVAVPAGGTVSVAATWTGVATERRTSVYYRFDKPPALGPAQLDAYAENPANTGHTPVAGGDRAATGQWADGVPFHRNDAGGPAPGANDELGRFLADLPAAGAAVAVTGYASYEPETGAVGDGYNQALSLRRAEAAAHLLARLAAEQGRTFSPQVHGAGNQAAFAEHTANPAAYEGHYTSYWRAEASYQAAPAADAHARATLRRPASPPITPPRVPMVPPPVRGRPDEFRSFTALARVAASRLLALECRLVVDFETAQERLLRALPDQQQPRPEERDTTYSDGVVDVHVVGSHDEATGELGFQASIRAADDDADGLWRLRSAEPSRALNMLGLLTALAPLLSDADPGEVGGWAKLGGVVVAAATLQELDVARVADWTVHGGELTTRFRDGHHEYTLMFDLETGILVTIEVGGLRLIVSDPLNPIRVRYRALGTRLNVGFDGQAPPFTIVFDASKGFTVDLPDGGVFQVPAPLGDILQVLGSRISRINPLTLELDLGMTADLGVVTVERATVQVTLDDPPSVTLTGLGVSVDVPGVLRGRGYLKIGADGSFAGGLDLRLTTLGVRVAAGVAIRPVPPPGEPNAGETATGVLLSLDVEFPVAIPLGNSGLGIFGFLGMFAMHHRRDEPEQAASPYPALDWYVHRARGNPASVESGAWVGALDRWAFGVGSVIGTMDGVILSLKGMLVVELPGPRLLVFMNADVLTPKPPLKPAGGDLKLGPILAVVDLDFGRGTFSIGLSVDLSWGPLIHAHVPAGAFFNATNPADFRLDLGTFADPARVEILGVIRASGYVMIHGNGITALGGQQPPIAGLTGLSLMTGAKAQLTWGVTAINLYARVAASFDLAVGFAPFLVAGNVAVSGELHLFVIGIGVSTTLTVRAHDDDVWIKGTICGKIDLFFFDLEGCVEITLGSAPQPVVPPLISGMSLVARSPALAEGTGTDTPIDAALTEATEGPADSGTVKVPVDAIPVLRMNAAPDLAEDFTSFCSSPGRPPTLAPTGIRQGNHFLGYTLTSVTIDPPLAPGDAEHAPQSVWWTRDGAPSESPSDPTAQLALLNWVPAALPKAVERGARLTETIRHRWGGVCDPVAPGAPVLWTFRLAPLGPSGAGWTLTGTPLPDPPGSSRSAPPPITLRVTEPWRTGNPLVDPLLGISPARVVQDQIGITHATGWARVLEAPFSYGRWPGERRSADYTAFKQQATREAPAPPELAEAIDLAADEVTFARLLVLVPTRLLEVGAFVQQALGEDGRVLGERTISLTAAGTRQVTTSADLPATWRDPAGAWSAGLLDILQLLQLLSGRYAPAVEYGYRVILTEGAVPEGTARIRLGVRDHGLWSVELGLGRPSYLLGAVEATSATEGRRAVWDETSRDEDRQRLEGALATDPGAQPMLNAGRAHTVTVTYTGRLRDEAGKQVAEKDFSQQFTFTVDDAPPPNLDPWVLCVHPSPGEAFHFHAEPVLITFATDTIQRYFSQYGLELEAMLRPASDQPATLKRLWELNAAGSSLLQPLAGEVFSPWEASVREVIQELPCVNGDHDTTRHVTTPIPDPLLPHTGYTLELSAVPPGGSAPPPGDGVHRPPFRRQFATGRYATPAELAAHVADAPVDHHHADAAALAALAALATRTAPTADEFEQALRAAGLAGRPLPDQPRRTVLWDAAVPPAPVAVLVETPEPIWRSRLEPRETEPDPDHDPEGSASTALLPALWLFPTATGPVAALRGDPGGARTLVWLSAGARGGTLGMHLVRRIRRIVDNQDNGQQTWPLASIALLRAPWEETS